MKKEKKITYGFMSVGDYEITLDDFAQRMTVLEGILNMETCKTSCSLKKGASEVMSAQDRVLFQFKDSPVIFIRKYEKT